MKTIGSPRQRPPHLQPPARLDSAVAPFCASQSWSSARPEMLVICCSDGRWHAQLEEFVRAEISDRADLYAVPGGPASLNPRYGVETAQVGEKALRFLVSEHQLDWIWLIAHQDCAFYRVRYGPMSAEYIDRCQQEDLRQTAALLRRWFPDLVVRQVLAARDGERVQFTWLHDEWA